MKRSTTASRDGSKTQSELHWSSNYRPEITNYPWLLALHSTAQATGWSKVRSPPIMECPNARTKTMGCNGDRRGQIGEFRNRFETIKWLHLPFNWGIKKHIWVDSSTLIFTQSVEIKTHSAVLKSKLAPWRSFSKDPCFSSYNQILSIKTPSKGLIINYMSYGKYCDNIHISSILFYIFINWISSFDK